MDSIFEYLILLFFIFSILNSIFGKKKKVKTESTTTVESPPDSQPKKSSRSILEEILTMGMPKEIPDLTAPTGDSTTTVADSEDTWFPEKEFENSYTSYSVKNRQIEKSETGVSEKSLYEQGTKIWISPLEELQEKKSEIEMLKDKIRNPATFREYFLVSEILSKPKALRR